MDNQIFVSSDGDAIGAQIGRASLADDMEMLASLEQKITGGNDAIVAFVESHGGQVISNGGDELNFTVPAEAFHELEALRKDYEYIVGATLTVGVGSKLSEANKALHVGKLTGKNKTVVYSPEIEQQWLKAQQEANDGTATGEAKKIGDAYMTNQDQKPAQTDQHDDCPYCKEEDHNTDDCPMCQELDAKENADGTAGMDDCPACKEYDNSEHNKDDCPLCKEYDAAQQGKTGSGLGFDDCPECQELYSQASENSPAQDAGEPPAAQGMETKDELLNAIDQAPGGDGETPGQIAQQIDDTELPQGLASDGNASVPENFGDAQETAEDQPGQEGQIQDNGQPQLGQVLQDGLNDQGGDIQRQKVIDMVTTALTSFKNQKDVLEQAKSQFPDFYSANIQMLRCMIELCKMLGLQPKKDQASYPAPENAPQPSAPQAAPQEGAAEAPQQ